MKPEELIELYAIEEAIEYVIKGLELSGEDALSEMLRKLFHNKVNDNDLSMDEYKALQEAYRNPPVKEPELPVSPFPWIKTENVGAAWRKGG